MSKTVIVILMIWLTIFLSEIWTIVFVDSTPNLVLETSHLSKEAPCPEISGTITKTGIAYHGLGYTINEWRFLSLKGKDTLRYSMINEHDVHPVPYLVINGMIITCLIMFRKRRAAMSILTKIIVVAALAATVVGMLTDTYNRGGYTGIFVCAICALLFKVLVVVMQKKKVKDQNGDNGESFYTE